MLSNHLITKKSFFLLFFLLLLLPQPNPSQNKNQTVNSVFGDISFVEKFGVEPNAQTDEKLRIKTHLQYVESFLRNKNVSSLSKGALKRRQLMLNILHKYILKGAFPKNYDYKNERRPCFIDEDGNICAVGYLIEQTAGRQLAERINNKYKYAFINGMNDKEISEWINNSGLTIEECAMIQPAYGEPEYNYHGPEMRLTTEYAITSSLTSGVNLTMATLNAISIANKERSVSKSIVGIVSGALQVILGLGNIQGGARYPSETKRVVSMFNIGLGSATTMLSVISLFSKDNDKPKSSGNKLIRKF